MRIIPFGRPEEFEAALPEVGRQLARDGVIAYPTETVYGLGTRLEPAALDRLARLKQRTADKPFLVLIDGTDRIPGLTWSGEATRLADAFWPGPLTLVLPAGTSRLPARVCTPEGAIAVRSSPHPAVRALLAGLGEPLTSTSANGPGEPPATTIRQVSAALRTLEGGSDVLLLDGGALPPSPPSTIVDCTTRPVRLLRPGAVSLAQLSAVVDRIDA